MPESNPPIAADILARRDEWARDFAAAQPFRHVVIDNFLRPDVCAAMIAQFPPFAAKNAIDEGGRVGGKSVHEDVRRMGPIYAQLDDYLRGPEFLEFMGQVCGIEDLLYDPLYYGGGTHDNLSGQQLDPHVDFNYHAKFGWHRRLNLIIYLNPIWEDSWGGAIELHRDPWAKTSANDIKSVLPIMNRCVVFETTESSWHGFRAVQLAPDDAATSRRSFAIYLYTLDRPPAVTAPRHDTVYVERKLADHIRPGCVLTQADHAEVVRLLTRRDQHLRRLYSRELKFSATIQNLREQLEASSGLRRTVLAVTQKLRPVLYRLRRRFGRR